MPILGKSNDGRKKSIWGTTKAKEKPIEKPIEKEDPTTKEGPVKELTIKEDPIKLQQRMAREECRKLCDLMCLQLPREIRDIIYWHLHPDETIYVGPEYLLKAGEPSVIDHDAHYWDIGYMGRDVKHEMIESWYRNTLFYFYDMAHNAHVVEKFLQLDRWNFGVKPRDFIRRVQFNLGFPADTNVLHTGPHCCIVTGLAETLTKPLKDMHQLPNHVHFAIRIHTYRAIEWRCLEGEELQRMLEVLMQDLKTLKAAGHQLVVRWSEFPELELCTKTGELDATAWMDQLEQAAVKIRQKGGVGW